MLKALELIEPPNNKKGGDSVKYTDIESKKDAIQLILEYLEDVAKRHPDERDEQLKKWVWFAIGFLKASDWAKDGQ